MKLREFAEVILQKKNTNIRRIYLQASSLEGQMAISSNPERVLLSGVTVGVQQAFDKNELANLEVTGVYIKDEETLTVVIE